MLMFLRRIALGAVSVLGITSALLFFASTLQAPMAEPPIAQTPLAVPKPITPITRETTAEQSPSVTPRSSPTRATGAPVAPTPTRAIRIELDPPARSSAAIPTTTPPSDSAFDFLRDYLTNRTQAIILDGKPWTNSTVNVAQYQQNLGGVTYWDFFSEAENWDSPFFMWQDDAGQWQPYRQETIRDTNGNSIAAYLLTERQGPGVMDHLWFTEDAAWMLATPQSKKDVGPIQNLDDLIEWGNVDKLGKLRIEVDDRVAYDGDLRTWLAGKPFGLTPELTQILTWRHREYGSTGNLIPIVYQKHLRVLLYAGTKKPKWFLLSGVQFPQATRVKPYTDSASYLPIADMTRLARNVTQPESFIQTFDHIHAFDLNIQAHDPASVQFNGAGTLGAFQFRIAKKFDPKQMRLAVTYANQTAIDLPLIAFFTDPTQLVAHRSTPLGVIETADAWLLYCNLPMPFQNGMTLELTTDSATPTLVSSQFALTRETADTQLRVDYRAPEKLAPFSPDYTVKLSGDGKLIGIVLATQDEKLDQIPKVFVPGTTNEDPVKRAWAMGYLEGNLTLLDGTGNSRIFGGQEDWADGGFYFNRGYTDPPGGANRPFGGILRYKDGNAGYATIFRYFNDLSAFRFKQGLTLAFGHGTWNNNFPVSYGSTVLYYKEIGAQDTRLSTSASLANR